MKREEPKAAVYVRIDAKLADWAREHCARADLTMAKFIEERIEACRARFARARKAAK